MENQEKNLTHRKEDQLDLGLKIVSFCIPLVGAIIYFSTDRQEYPTKAQEACYAALWGIGVGIAVQIISVLIVGGM